MDIIEIKEQNSFFEKDGYNLFNLFSRHLQPENYFNSFKGQEKCYSWVVKNNNEYVAGCNIIFNNENKSWFIKDLYSIDEKMNSSYFPKILNHIILFNLKTKRELNTFCHDYNEINPFDFLSIPINYEKVKMKHYLIPYKVYQSLKNKIDDFLTLEIIKECVCKEMENHYYFKVIDFDYEIPSQENRFFLNDNAFINLLTKDKSSLDTQLLYYNIKPEKVFSLNFYGSSSPLNSITIDYLLK